MSVRLVDKFGALVADLTHAVPTHSTSELNGWDSGSFTMHTRDPQATLVKTLASEVQFYRGANLTFWGRPTRVGADADRVRFDCRGIGWELFDRRFIGRADRTNLLGNPEFEDAVLTPWAATNTTASIDTTRRKLGTQSVKLVQSTALQDAYLSQTLDNYTATGVGSLLTVVAWFHIQNAGWVGEAVNKRGLTISRKHATTGAILYSGVFEIDGETPRGSWQRAEVTVWMPPNAVEDIEVRLYSPGGTIWWDATSLTLMESLSNYATDQTEIARQIAVHLQDPAYSKSDINIATSTPASGVLRDRHYQHADHHRGADAIGEFAGLSDGFDYAVVVTPTTRTFTTFSPRRGTRHSALTITDQNVAGFNWSVDGEAACSSITVLGEGDGPDREEGAAVDSALFGGLVVEDIINAPAGSEIDALDPLAAEALRVRKASQVLTVTVSAASGWFAVHPGDTLPSNFAWGFVSFTNDWRVTSRSLDHVADVLTFEMNPA